MQTMLHLTGHYSVRYLTPTTFFAVLPTKATARASFPFDFLIIDWHLPEGLSGIQMCHQIRDRFPTLPILLISAVSSWEREATRKASPSIQVLGEPFTIAALLAVITSGNTAR